MTHRATTPLQGEYPGVTFEPAPEMLIGDLETFQLLLERLRMSILQLLLHRALPVRTLAEELGVPVTRLYYHVNLLEDAGIITVVDVRKAGAMMQKVYRASAYDYRPASDLVESAENPAEAARLAVTMVLNSARTDAERVLAERFADPEGEHRTKGALARSMLRMSPDQVEELSAKILELVDQYQTPDAEGDLVGLTFLLFPVGIGSDD